MRTVENKIDPRTKLIMVLCISFLAIIVRDLVSLFQLSIITLILSISFGNNLKSSLFKFKNFLYVIVGIAVLQSLFSNQGMAIFAIGKFTLITDYGLKRGIEFILRMIIVVLSANILATSSSREIIQGFVQMGMPYELAFMVATGIRFLPIMRDEIRDSVIAIQLRGIDLDKISIRERINIYSYIFMPIVLGSISKAEKLAISIEMRGFRAYDRRTSYNQLSMSKFDYILISTSIIFTTVFLILYLY